MSRSWLAPVPCILIPFVTICACCTACLSGLTKAFQLKTTPSPTPVISRPQVVSTQAVEVLDHTTVPVNDPIDLAGRLKDEHNIPLTVPPPAAPLQTGDQQTFWITDQDSGVNSQVDATLRYITDHVYFWVEDGVDYSQSDLRKLVDTFETSIYPTDREYFGSEWTPGIDGDVHLYMLYSRGLGGSIAGYFSTPDEYPPQAHPYSNAHEMFMLNVDNQSLSDSFTYGVLAHEFQHMIQWNQDRDESTWLNEGFSEMATLLNGYADNSFARRYASNPDIQLTDWPDDSSAALAHYGASFMFVSYFYDRFGAQGLKSLSMDPLHGLDSVDDVLQKENATDPASGKPFRADDLFADWALASYLNDPSISGGRYAYHIFPDAPRLKATVKESHCPLLSATRSVHQYGIEIIRITCKGDYTLHFDGSTSVKLNPQQAHSGSYAFWSNEGDMMDTTLTRAFDFTGHTGPLTLNYWTWYMTEPGFDYTYLEASTDNENWTVLNTPACTTADQSGNSYGCGYTNLSGGGAQAQWIAQSVDLSHYAGQKVWLRFEYITDAAVDEDGFLLDDVSIPEVGYTNDFETDDGGWQAQGFARVQNELPQTFRVALITKGKETNVQYIPLSADVSADISLHIGGDVSEAALVVSGTTRFTRELAVYQYEIR